MKKPVKTGFFVPCAPKGALVYGILQAFASLKSRNIAGLDLDGFTGSRITSRTCSASLHREGSEANQRYGTTVSECALNAIEYCVDCLGCISS